MDCHELIDDMERECLRSHNVHLVIHYDPVVTDDPEQNRMRNLVAAILRVKDERLTIHDFRMAEKQLVFDVTLPASLQGQEEALRQTLEQALNDLGERDWHLDITFDLEG